MKQFAVKDEDAFGSIQNTLKVAALEGDKKLQNFGAIFYCDSKPVYFLTTVLVEIKGVHTWEEIFQ